MNHFQHPQALVESKKIGKDTRIWAFAHVLPGAEIGEDCNICDHTFVENDVVIGNRVTIKCGVYIWDGIRIEDDVFIGPNVVFTNDRFPRSKQYPEAFLVTIIRRGASIGANATLLPGITIGQNAMVGAGAVVTRNVPPNAIVVGNPAIIKGYIDADSAGNLETLHKDQKTLESKSSKVSGVKIFSLPIVEDMRGRLSVAEYDKGLPFVPTRYFLVYDVPSREVRGEHAHFTLQEFLVCIKGSCCVVLDDGENREEFLLDSINTGLYIPPLIWSIQFKYTKDAILLVLASDIYKPEDYIRSYDEFLKVIGK